MLAFLYNSTIRIHFNRQNDTIDDTVSNYSYDNTEENMGKHPRAKFYSILCVTRSCHWFDVFRFCVAFMIFNSLFRLPQLALLKPTKV